MNTLFKPVSILSFNKCAPTSAIIWWQETGELAAPAPQIHIMVVNEHGIFFANFLEVNLRGIWMETWLKRSRERERRKKTEQYLEGSAQLVHLSELVPFGEIQLCSHGHITGTLLQGSVQSSQRLAWTQTVINIQAMNKHRTKCLSHLANCLDSLRTKITAILRWVWETVWS